MPFLRRLLVFAALLGTATMLQGQSISASMYGRVLDSANAVMPGVTVRAINVDTGTVYQFLTDSLGNYDFPQVRLGSYRLEASVQGFQTTVQAGIVLELNQRAKIDLVLQVGSVNEKVEVTAQAPLLETATGAMGQVVTHKQVEDLPLVQRMPWYLALITPGVNPGYSMSASGQPFNRTGNFSINGSRAGSNEMMVDGVSTQVPGAASAQIGFTYLAVYPPMEATQEFKIYTNAYAAEFGKSGGGAVTLSIKSGTNSFHGALYEFLQNDALNANQWFSNFYGLGKSRIRLNQFGGAVGGPVIRNRTFFFYDYQGLRETTQGQPTTSTLPSLEMVKGDFTNLRNAAGGLITIYDPTTAGPGQPRTPFPGNVIPAGRMDPVAVKVAALLPATRRSAGNAFTGVGNNTVAVPTMYNDNQWDLKIDHRLNDRNQLFYRHSWYHHMYQNSLLLPGSTWDNINPLDSGGLGLPTQSYQMAAGYTRTISPTTLFDFRAGQTHLAWQQIVTTFCIPGACAHPFDPTSVGFPGYIKEFAGANGFPPMNLSNYDTLGSTQPGQNQTRNAVSIQTSLTKITGRHVLKFGFDGRREESYSGSWTAHDGTYSFDAGFTQRVNNVSAAQTQGNSWASFLLGTPSSGNIQKYAPPHTRSGYYAIYAQDDFKLSSKLTLNPGLRWDISKPMRELHDQIAFLDLGPNPLGALAGMPDLKSGLQFANQGSLKGIHNTIATQWHSIAPRLGIAYQMTPSTVIRSGGGFFFMGSFGSAVDTPSTSFSATTSMIPSLDGATPYNYLSNPFPQGFTLPRAGADGMLTNVGLSISGIAGTNSSKTPYMAQWNFNIERQLPGSFMVEAAYVGSTSKGLDRGQLNLDELAPQYASLGNALNQLVSNPFYGLPQIPSTSTLAQPTVQRGQLLRPYPLFTGVTMWDSNGASAKYNSVRFKAEKRLSQGLTVLASYVIAKSMDDGSGIPSFLGSPIPGGTQGPRTIYDLRREWSLSALDVSQRFVTAYTYELPFGHGRKWLNSKGPLDWFLGGWQVNGIVTISTGMPVSIYTSNNYMGFGAGPQRPNSTGISAALSGPAVSRLGPPAGGGTWFNTAAFSQPTPFTIGNLARTLPDVRSDGVHNWDSSFFKTFKFKERFALTYRAEMFNFANTPTFQQPVASLTATNFGSVTATANTARQMQMALRLSF